MATTTHCSVWVSRTSKSARETGVTVTGTDHAGVAVRRQKKSTVRIVG
jgi:hypothetical protein